MDEQTVRDHAQAVCAAIVAGDVGRVIEDLSKELKQNLGEVVSLLPLPASAATIESIEPGSSGFVVVLRLVGDTEEVLVQTRWKDRDDRPTIVEASHLSRTELAAPEVEGVGDEGAGEAS
jgi:hypothetical protein